jgi:hypothetical protein
LDMNGGDAMDEKSVFRGLCSNGTETWEVFASTSTASY